MENKDIQEYFIQTSSDKLEDVKNSHPEALFIHVHDEKDGNVVNDNLYAGDCRITDNFNIGGISDEIETSLGTIGDLRNKSMSEIVLGLICPLKTPSVNTNPSISITYGGVKNILIKVGDNLPSKDTITITTNKGSFSNGESYAGDYNGDTSLNISESTWGSVCEEKTYVISGSGTFSEGIVPKDTHGNEHSELQYEGGLVQSNDIIIKGVYPIYVNSLDITSVNEELELKDYSSEQSWKVEIPAEIDDSMDKFKIKLPYEFSSIIVYQENPLTKAYDIPISMVKLPGDEYIYIRTLDKKDTNTDKAKYEIKLKK